MRENWSLLQKLSYETNKRLRRQEEKSKKLKEEELARKERFSFLKRLNRREQVEYLKKNFHEPIYAENSEHIKLFSRSESELKKAADIPKGEFSLLLGDLSNNEIKNLLEKTLKLVNETPFLGCNTSEAIGETKSKVCTTQQIEAQPQVFVHSKNHDQEAQKDFGQLSGHQALAKRKPEASSHDSLDEGTCQQLPRCNSPTVIAMAPSSEKPPQSQSGNSSTNASIRFSETSADLTLSVPESLHWLRTGKPPLDCKCFPTESQDSNPLTFDPGPARVTYQPPAAQQFASSTIPLIRMAPSYSFSQLSETQQHKCITPSLIQEPTLHQGREHNDSEVEVTTEAAESDVYVASTDSGQKSTEQHGKALINTLRVVDYQSNSMAFYGTNTVPGISQPGSTHPDFIQISRTFNPLSPVASPLENVRPPINEPAVGDASPHRNIRRRRSSSPLRGILKSRYSPKRTSLERPNGFTNQVAELKVERTRDSIELAPARLRNRSITNSLCSSDGTIGNVPDSPDSLYSGSSRSARKTVRFADEVSKTNSLVSSSDIDQKQRDFLQTSGVASYFEKKVNPNGPVISVIYPKLNSPVDDHSKPPDQTPSPIWNSNYRLPSLQSPTQLPIRGNEYSNCTSVPQTLHEKKADEPVKPTSTAFNKLPLQPTQSKSNCTVKLGYAELLIGRPKRQANGDQYVFTNERSIWAPSINPSPIIIPAAGDVDHTQNGSSPVIHDNNSPNMSSQDADTASSHPTSNRPWKSPKPKLLDSNRLNNFVRNISPTEYCEMPLRRGNTTNHTLSSNGQRSPFTENLKGATQNKENSRESLIYNQNDFSGSSHTIQETPDYEGLDTVQAEMTDLNCSQLVSNSTKSAIAQTSISKASSLTGTKCDSRLRFDPIRTFSLSSLPSPRTGRQVTFDPHEERRCTNLFTKPDSSSVHTPTTCMEGLPSIVLDPPGSTSRQLHKRSRQADEYIASPNQTSSISHYITPRATTEQQLPASKRISPTFSELSANGSNLPNVVTHISFQHYDRSRSLPPKPYGNREPTVSNSVRQIHLDSVEDISEAPTDSLAEFIKSERACQRTDLPLLEVSKPLSSRRLPVSSGRLKQPSSGHVSGASAISIEESRLLQSLDRLNTRLNELRQKNR